MTCCVTESGVCLLCVHWTSSVVLLVLTYGFPDDSTPGVPKHEGRKLCINFFFNF